jgi:hypothetical protein
VIDTVGPLLALAPVRRRPEGRVAIVDGTLIPTRDHRLAAQSKNYCYSANLRVAIDANTRMVIAATGANSRSGNRTTTADNANPRPRRTRPGPPEDLQDPA